MKGFQLAKRLDNMPGTRKYSILLYIALIAAGLAGNYFKLSILNADFIFGSIFAMLALQFFGLGRGVVAAAVIAGYTYLAWNHPYALITMTAEAAMVGWLITGRRLNLLMADTLYWLFIGIPLGFFCFHVIADVPVSNAMFLMTKQAVNGIANALVARLVFAGYSFRSNTSLISFREIMANMLVFFVLCPALILLAVASRGDLAETDRSIRSSLLQNSRRVTDGLENWVDNREIPVIHLAAMAKTLSPLQMQPHLEQARMSDANFLRIALLDREATITAISPLFDEFGKSGIGKNFADRPFIPTLKRTLKPMLSEVIMAKLGAPTPITTMLAPVVIRGEYGGYVSGILNFARIETILRIHSAGSEMHYSLLDKNGNVIATNRKDQKNMTPFYRSRGTLTRPEESGIARWIPELPSNTSTIDLWGKSFYVVESTIGNLAEWKLIMEQPVAPFQKKLYDIYTGRLSLVFILLLAALAIAEVVSRRVAVTNEELSNLTRDLPSKLASGATIKWPESGIQDSSKLIDNFREMANALSARFNEIRHLNESLEQRVEERTEELRESENEFRSLAESMPQIVWITRPDGWNIYFNQQWVDYTGLTLEESYGHGWNKPFHPDDQQRAWDAWQNATQHGAAYALECRLRRADGVYMWWLIRGVPILNEHGLVLKWFGTCTDIHEHKLAEAEILRLNAELEQRVIERTAQLESAYREIEAFSYSVSHDLKAPLRAISGFASIIARRHREGLNEEAQHYFDNIVTASDRMSALITDLLEYSRIGRRTIELKPVPLAQILPQVVDVLSDKIKETGTAVSIPDDLPAVLGDAGLIRQAFTNLLENALIFRKEAIPLIIEIGYTLEKDRLTVRVTDNGIGIPKEFHEKIFNMFQRLHSEDQYEGTGIGLAIVRKAMKLMDGDVRVESEPGKGSSFFITFRKE